MLATPTKLGLKQIYFKVHITVQSLSFCMQQLRADYPRFYDNCAKKNYRTRNLT